MSMLSKLFCFLPNCCPGEPGLSEKRLYFIDRKPEAQGHEPLHRVPGTGIGKNPGFQAEPAASPRVRSTLPSLILTSPKGAVEMQFSEIHHFSLFTFH